MQSNGLIIGAGLEQLPVIELAQTMGLGVVAVDGSSKAPGLNVADYGFVLDLANIDEIISIAARYHCCCVLPAPIGAFLTTVGSVNDALGLRGISLDAARNCVDKQEFEKVVRRAGLPVPKRKSAVNRRDIVSSAEDVGYPLVLKACRGSGSRGLFVARSRAELEVHLEWHLSQRESLPGVQTTMLQTFVEGVEVGVDAVMAGREYYPLNIRGKELTPLPYRLGYGYFSPAGIGHSQNEKVHLAVQRAAVAVGLQNCFMHADVLIDTAGTCWVIELSGRPAGFHIATKMLPLLLGFHPLRQTIEMLRGNCSFPALPVHPVCAALLRMLEISPCDTIQHVAGIESVRRVTGVAACECYLQPGDCVVERKDGPSGFRAGYILTFADTLEEADKIWCKAAGMIHFDVNEQDRVI